MHETERLLLAVHVRMLDLELRVLVLMITCSPGTNVPTTAPPAPSQTTPAAPPPASTTTGGASPPVGTPAAGNPFTGFDVSVLMPCINIAH